ERRRVDDALAALADLAGGAVSPRAALKVAHAIGAEQAGRTVAVEATGLQARVATTAAAWVAGLVVAGQQDEHG
ncbi:MAG: hypothetical protein ACI9U2_003611, partial [Bradymonadia bacterium]